MFKKDFYITDNDKEWVHETFKWLLDSFGYPEREFSPYLLTKEFFPETVAHRTPAIEPLLADLCNLFQIDPSIISFSLEADITDSYGTPYQVQGSSFECDVETIRTENGYHYKLVFAKRLLKNPKRLVFNAVYHFIRIRLAQGDINWIKSEGHYFSFYLIGVYTGWGVLFSQTMIDIGRETDGTWERTWKYISPMPIPVIAYSMALRSSLIDEEQPAWKNYLPADIRVQYELSVNYIKKNGNPFYNKQELTAKALFKEGWSQAGAKKFDSALELYKKGLFVTENDKTRALLQHNIGYTLLLKGEFENSIPYFQKALEIIPNFSYSHANMGFAFMMMGDIDTGKYYQNLANKTGNEIEAYSHRNFAIYYQKKGELDKARESFIKAFETITVPVDWLEYLYAKFLYDQGEQEEAMFYLQMAIDKGEPKAIEWMNEISNAG